jgi:hypothetical protein
MKSGSSRFCEKNKNSVYYMYKISIGRGTTLSRLLWEAPATGTFNEIYELPAMVLKKQQLSSCA